MSVPPSPTNAGSASLSPRLYPWVIGVYASFALAIMAVLVIAGWGVYVDLEETRKGLLQAEIHRLRSHAVRTVLRIQNSLATSPMTNLEETIDEAAWLRDHWQTFVPMDPSRLYAAVIDENGMILMHSRPEAEGFQLAPDWYSRTVDGVGDDVVETTDPNLAGGAQALDISLPIMRGQREIGSYHSGFNVKWFDEMVTQRRAATRQRWTFAFLIISLIIALAGASLYHVTRRLSALQNAIALGRVRRLADLGQLAGGIAHEIRNPLNAIRINLHVIEQLMHAQGNRDERTEGIIRETVHEMERIDGLLRTLLEYARPDRTRIERINLADEVRIIGELIRPIMERESVRLQIETPEQAFVTIDRNRFRQVSLNLLKNALEAVGNDGTVRATLELVGDEIVFTVYDTGCGLDSTVAARMYDPFFTTKELGTGLGLTLVKRYVEDAGGEIAAAPNQPQGTVFTIRWPSKSVAAARGADSDSPSDSIALVSN